MKRYRLFSEIGVKNIFTYNAACEKDPERQKLPQVVILIDELADLMIAAAKEVEESICRIAQMARAAGMHLIIATQRPSADVITGLMKANIPSRIAFAVASQLESRIILDTPGAEKLVGRGDMLYFPLGSGKPVRIQGTLIGEEEVEAVVEFVKKSGEPEYSDEIMQHMEKATEEKKGGSEAAQDARDEGDELLPAAVEVVLESGQASVSMLQRRLKLGYSRAARLVDQMEDRGIVGPFEGSKPRQLLITKAQWQEMQLINGTAPTENFRVMQEFGGIEETDEEE
jgi:S-DNA-T family DNA segregation ATPase FtsK/SpoIIIE